MKQLQTLTVDRPDINTQYWYMYVFMGHINELPLIVNMTKVCAEWCILCFSPSLVRSRTVYFQAIISLILLLHCQKRVKIQS